MFLVSKRQTNCVARRSIRFHVSSALTRIVCSRSGRLPTNIGTTRHHKNYFLMATILVIFDKPSSVQVFRATFCYKHKAAHAICCVLCSTSRINDTNLQSRFKSIG
jgi:hypothetical protein